MNKTALGFESSIYRPPPTKKTSEPHAIKYLGSMNGWGQGGQKIMAGNNNESTLNNRINTKIQNSEAENFIIRSENL